MKTKIFMALILIASIAMFSTGAFAYFTTTGEATGNIHSGNLDLKIAAVVPSAACPAVIDQAAVTLWALDNLAPGDIITGKLCMKNTGSLNIPQVAFNWNGMDGKLAEHLFVTKLYNSKTDKDEIADYVGAYDRNGDGKMSLAELNATNYTIPSGVLDEYWVGGAPIFLTVGDTQWVEYTFQFDPAVGNSFENLNFSYRLDITGFQKAFDQANPTVP